MAHAWMVRTFVKHSEEVEEFPELMGIVRAIFDVSLALESRRHDPARYLRMLRTKFDRLRRAADEFRRLAPEASSHTNFRQAVISMDACIEDLQSVLDTSSDLLRVAR
ncbi:MAG: amidohydrolase [Planctomycetes bacterium]|nr:amidohydrolase [Planctomycetota bacterium]